jgi:proteic killer suppression protein
MLDDAKDLRDLNTKGNRLEKLKGDRKVFWSIRINDLYRIVFKWWDRRVATASFRP